MKKIKGNKLLNEFYCNGINRRNDVVSQKRLPELRYRIQSKEFVLYYADANGKDVKAIHKCLQEFYDDKDLTFILQRFYFKQGTLEKAVRRAKGLLRKKHSKVDVYKTPKVVGVSLEPKYKGRYRTEEDVKKEELKRAEHNKKVAVKRKAEHPDTDYLADYLEEDKNVWVLSGQGKKYEYDEKRRKEAVKEFENDVALYLKIK